MITVVYILAIILMVSIDTSIFCSILEHISVRKRSKTFTFIGLAILMMIVIASNIFSLLPSIIIILNMVMVGVFYKINYEVDAVNCMLITMIYWLVLSAAEAISIVIVAIVASIDISVILSEIQYKVIAAFLSKVILISVFIIYRNKMFMIKMKKDDFALIAKPIISNMLCLFIIFKWTCISSSDKLINNYIILSITIIVILSNISIFKIIRSLIRSNELKLENTIIKQKITMDYENYINLQKSYKELKELKHDMKNHIICISELYKNKDNADDYIKEISKRIDSINIFNTGNSIIDIILGEKKRICIENNIEFISKISFKKNINIESIDLSNIFSNSLDNAIEACCKINDKNIKRYIDIKNKYIGGIMVIKVENSKVNDIKVCNNIVVTDKQDTSTHGFGISSIKTCVKKYNGEVVVDYTKNKFALKIIMSI